ncbi:MAG: hypothetical protein ACK4K9_09920 [Bacteroidia bacterium]
MIKFNTSFKMCLNCFTNKILFFISVFILPAIAISQNTLIIENLNTGKKFKAIPGSTISVYYSGYQNQIEYYKNTLLDLTDSSIVLGMFYLPQLSYGNEKPKPYKEILLKDITKIRKISIGKNLIKTALNIATIYGSFYIFQNHINRQNYSTLQNFGITLSFGIGSNVFVNSILNEKPKFSIKDGWKIYTTIE